MAALWMSDVELQYVAACADPRQFLCIKCNRLFSKRSARAHFTGKIHQVAKETFKTWVLARDEGAAKHGAPFQLEDAFAAVHEGRERAAFPAGLDVEPPARDADDADDVDQPPPKRLRAGEGASPEPPSASEHAASGDEADSAPDDDTRYHAALGPPAFDAMHGRKWTPELWSFVWGKHGTPLSGVYCPRSKAWFEELRVRAVSNELLDDARGITAEGMRTGVRSVYHKWHDMLGLGR